LRTGPTAPFGLSERIQKLGLRIDGLPEQELADGLVEPPSLVELEALLQIGRGLGLNGGRARARRVLAAGRSDQRERERSQQGARQAVLIATGAGEARFLDPSSPDARPAGTAGMPAPR